MSLRFALAALALSAAVIARAESTPTRFSSPRAPSPLLVALDTDHDGSLSASEIAAAPLTLRALDLDNDGVLSPEELSLTSGEGRVRRGAGGFNLVLALDANQDGELQAMEIANAVASLQQLDRNGDSILTPDELRPTLVARAR